jgi:hypothetical protein
MSTEKEDGTKIQILIILIALIPENPGTIKNILAA